MFDQLKAIAGQAAAAKAKYIEEAKTLLTPAILSVFKFDEVEKVKWTQYTPYFNDGEPCVFSVGDIYVRSNKSTEEEGEEDEGFEYISSYNKKVPDGFSAEAWAALNELSDALSGMHDVLEEAFGDHVQVFVTREGIEVEEYEHD